MLPREPSKIFSINMFQVQSNVWKKQSRKVKSWEENQVKKESQVLPKYATKSASTKTNTCSCG